VSDRKVYVEAKVRLIIRVDEGVDIADVIGELEYEFTDTTGSATIVDAELRDYEVKDSK
jgi:hypothetical protein